VERDPLSNRQPDEGPDPPPTAPPPAAAILSPDLPDRCSTLAAAPRDDPADGMTQASLLPLSADRDDEGVVPKDDAAEEPDAPVLGVDAR
jgi:hypothetical protein